MSRGSAEGGGRGGRGPAQGGACEAAAVPIPGNVPTETYSPVLQPLRMFKRTTLDAGAAPWAAAAARGGGGGGGSWIQLQQQPQPTPVPPVHTRSFGLRWHVPVLRFQFLFSQRPALAWLVQMASRTPKPCYKTQKT